MGSTFGSYNIALTSLFAQAQALDVTGQNVANSNTDGYTRQRVSMQALGPSVVPAVYARSDLSSGGVTVTGVARLRDAFLEKRGLAEHAKSEALTADVGTLSEIEQLYTEPSDTGIQSQLSDLWDGFATLAGNPGDSAARRQTLERSGTVASTLNAAAVQLRAQWSQTRQQASVLVDEVNTTASNIATLNQAILRANQAGTPANDLKDQRDVAIMNLSKIAGVTSSANADSTVNIVLDGSSLVTGTTVSKLALGGAPTLDDLGYGAGGAQKPVTVTWSSLGNTPVSVPSGQLGSLMVALNSTIPQAGADLDGWTQQFAASVNDQLAKGQDLNGNPGAAMFTDGKGGTGSTITARTISVGIQDTSLIAAAAATGGPNLDGTNATALAALGSVDGGPTSAYQKLVAAVGVQVRTAQNRADIQTSVVGQVDAMREADSGVNIDEEMTNLLMYQRGYQAASKLLVTMDSCLDTLINHLGA